jgi:hypothetical protein
MDSKRDNMVARYCISSIFMATDNNERSQNISSYSPYSVAMRKSVGAVEARRVLAPETKIITENMAASESTPTGTRMPATSRIPVSKVVWGELAGLKKPGETYDHLLEGMIEREKKNRLFEDMDRIEKRGKFVAVKW